MFVNTQLKGQNTCFPDTCKTPAPPAPPIPTPYPNMSMQNTGAPPVVFVLIENAPAHNIGTQPKLSNGDEAGALGGIVSNMIMGPTQVMMGSTVLLIDGKPAAMMLSPTGHNGSPPNGMGSTLVPSQVTVMVMA